MHFCLSLTLSPACPKQLADLAYRRTDLAAGISSPTRRRTDECLAHIGMARSASSDPSAKPWRDLTDADLRRLHGSLLKFADKGPQDADKLQARLREFEAELEARQQARDAGDNAASKQWLASVSPTPPHPTLSQQRTFALANSISWP